jgi:hypothetical protein
MNKHPLVNCCFMVRSPDDGRMQWQGHIHAVVPSNTDKGDLALVQFFDGWGALGNMALIPLAEMTTLAPDDGGSRFNRWVLFTDDAHLRDYCDTYQRPREEQLDALAERKFLKELQR